jgi:hypothetical protein
MSPIGTFETWRPTLTMSVSRGRPDRHLSRSVPAATIRRLDPDDLGLDLDQCPPAPTGLADVPTASMGLFSSGKAMDNWQEAPPGTSAPPGFFAGPQISKDPAEAGPLVLKPRWY